MTCVKEKCEVTSVFSLILLLIDATLVDEGTKLALPVALDQLYSRNFGFTKHVAINNFTVKADWPIPHPN